MFRGAITALATPMRRGQVDLAKLRELVELQVDAKIDGLVPCGTTGEAATLTADERAQVIRAVAEQARGRTPVIAGAGANSTRAAIENGVLAREAGADALLHVTPYYNKPTGPGLVAHFRAVAEATDLPIVVYNVPGRTGCDMQPATVAELAAIERIVAIKEATGSIARAQQVIAACPAEFAVLSGDDATALALVAVGGRGVISVVSNLCPAEMHTMVALGLEGKLEEARAINYRLLPLMDLLFVESNPIPVKAALSLMGFGENELRLPLLPLAGDKLERLRAELGRQGLLR
jgi:4-hydroxy-tetrahydrodipicolinate synthase